MIVAVSSATSRCDARVHLQKITKLMKFTPRFRSLRFRKSSKFVAHLSVKKIISPHPITVSKPLVKAKSVSSLVPLDASGGSNAGSNIDVGGWTVVNRRSKQFCYFTKLSNSCP